MPLMQGKSKKAFEHNVTAEIHAGKPQKQSLAIAYDVKRKNQRKKMAQGGTVTAPAEHEATADNGDTLASARKKKSLVDADWTGAPQDKGAQGNKSAKLAENETDWAEGEATEDSRTYEEMNMKGASSDPLGINADHAEDDKDALHLAHGGDVDEHYDSIADAILSKKRKAKMMAEGGMVDLEENSEESPNNEDQMSFKANGKEQYDLSQLGDEPEDSNEHGDEREMSEENQHDMVDSIRRKMKMKRMG